MSSKEHSITWLALYSNSKRGSFVLLFKLTYGVKAFVPARSGVEISLLYLLLCYWTQYIYLFTFLRRLSSRLCCASLYLNRNASLTLSRRMNATNSISPSMLWWWLNFYVDGTTPGTQRIYKSGACTNSFICL